MPERYSSHRLRLQLEMGKLLDWGSEAGIKDNQSAFDRRMKVNGVIVMAVLGEIRSLLKSIRLLSLTYDKALDAQSTDDITTLPVRDQSAEAIDWKEYYAMFETGLVQKEQRSFPESMKSALRSAKNGVISIDRHRLRGVRWAMKDEKSFEDKLQRLTELTSYLHQTLGDEKMQGLL